jgi:hypothetical protein
MLKSKKPSDESEHESLTQVEFLLTAAEEFGQNRKVEQIHCCMSLSTLKQKPKRERET